MMPLPKLAVYCILAWLAPPMRAVYRRTTAPPPVKYDVPITATFLHVPPRALPIAEEDLRGTCLENGLTMIVTPYDASTTTKVRASYCPIHTARADRSPHSPS